MKRERQHAVLGFGSWEDSNPNCIAGLRRGKQVSEVEQISQTASVLSSIGWVLSGSVWICLYLSLSVFICLAGKTLELGRWSDMVGVADAFLRFARTRISAC